MNVTELFGRNLTIDERDRLMEHIELLVDEFDECYDQTGSKEVQLVTELLERAYAILQESVDQTVQQKTH